MYTVVRSRPGHSFAGNAAHTQDSKQSPEHAALVPRSALQESDGPHIQNDVAHVSSLLDADGYRSLNMDFPRGSQASTSMEVTHQVLSENAARTSDKSTRHGSVSEVGTVRGPYSPRKPLPAQWLSSNNGPNLATAQRAKERGHKKGSMGGSPIEAKTLSGARSLVDMSRNHGTDGASFLTKTAHAAIESDLTSPPSAKSPTKHQRTLSKPAWNSPAVSSHRDDFQQPNFVTKASPGRTTSVGGDAVAVGEGHVVSSVAKPVEESVHHYAGKSPTVQKSIRFQASTKAAMIGKGSKPGLKIEIPPTNACLDTDNSSATSQSSASGIYAIDDSPHSPVSATATSRIPRVATVRATSTARGPTRSSTLKRAHSAKSLTSPQVTSHGLGQGTYKSAHISPSAGPIRHVRTANSSGTTPILSTHHTPERVDHANNISIITEADSPPAQRMHATIEGVVQSLDTTHLNTHCDSSAESLYAEGKGSRASSTSTVKAAPNVEDPDVLDSAIIYSKKIGASGMTLDQEIKNSTMNRMLAHNCGTGTFRDNVGPQHGASAGSASLKGLVQNPSPVRGRAAHYVPTVRRQAESEPLLNSLASELRATAPDFVPHSSPSVHTDSAEVNPLPQAGAIAEFLGPVKYELDTYGIPWSYYMYQVQLAYHQGFRTGRSRSPKKVRQKKHRSSVSSPTDTTQVQKEGGKQSFNIPPPMSTVPLAVQRAQKQQDSAIGSANEATGTSQVVDSGAESRSVSPFAAQKEMIDRHYAFHNLTVTDRVPPDFDLTTIRNVGLPSGPRNVPLQASLTNNMPSRGRAGYGSNRRFNNHSDNGLYTYHNRGVAGVRMQDTVPFPDPVPPQGRPASSVVGSETCEAVNVVYAAERVAGETCYGCEPDHPLE